MTPSADRRCPESAHNLLDRIDSEQWDLSALCADREIITNELFVPNDWYGDASVLKTYAGLPCADSLKAVLPHGIYFNDDFVAEFEEKAGLPAVLVFENHRLGLYARDGVLAIPSAAPFCYANRLVDYKGPRRGTLFVPMHSTHWVTLNTDWEALADVALALDSPDNPVDVMIYWRDYLLGRHLPFEERGLRLVSSGHMYDSEFMLRQAYLFQSHAHVVSNGMGSHVFYAAHVGCPVHLSPLEFTIDDALAPEPSLSDERALEWRRISELFMELRDEVTPDQRAVAEEYVGASRMLEPRDLRRLLLWIDSLDAGGRAIFALGMPSGAKGRVGSASWLPFERKRNPRNHRARIENLARRVVERSIAILRAVFPLMRRVRLRRRDSD